MTYLYIADIVLGGFLLTCLLFIGLLLYQFINKVRHLNSTGKLKAFISYVFVLSCLGIGVYLLPMTVFNISDWSSLIQASSEIHIFTGGLLGISILIFSLYSYIVQISHKEDERQFFLLCILSIFSGISYSMIMIIINWVVSGGTRNIFIAYYFVLTLICYVSSMKTVRRQLTVATNGYVFGLRKRLVDKIIKTPFYKLEQLGDEEIYTTLNNDTEVISNVIGIVTLGVTCIVSLICCFTYLAILNIAAVIISLITIIIGGLIMLFMNRSAFKSFEASRRLQSTFYSFVGELVNGFKELSLNRKKRLSFQNDMLACNDDYKENKNLAEIISANIYFVGELLAIGILGSVVFILPVLFPDVENSVLREFVFLFLYLKGPIDNILNMIPRITHAKVSWNKVKSTYRKLEDMEEGMESLEAVNTNNFGWISLEDIEFQYDTSGERKFVVGPVNITFNSGEITFITGGNGSGKSTLLKLVTGLYKAHSGEITVNGNVVSHKAIGEYMTTILGDFHLFSKIYGVNCAQYEKEIHNYLKILQLEDKVSIQNGAFSTTDLSTGQRKRLALLISFLEDKPIYVFDEWAADQDPEFRAFFYNNLLPELKLRGKCIIAVTHDDHYFNLADQMIKMELGKIEAIESRDRVKLAINE